MNSTRKPPAASGTSQPSHQPARQGVQPTPAIAQRQTVVSAQSRKRPVTSVQPKLPGSAAANRDSPVAPSVYRSQPLPRVLQKKTSSAQSLGADQAPLRPVAPSVYRPQTKLVGVKKVPVAPSISPCRQTALQRKNSSLRTTRENANFVSIQKRQVIQRADLQWPRLRPEVVKSSNEEWDAHNERWKYNAPGLSGNPNPAEDIERHNMQARLMYATALDELSRCPTAFDHG
jgi:hypothetical protein